MNIAIEPFALQTKSVSSSSTETAMPWASVTASEDLEALAPEWRALSENGLATPYQSYGWISSYAKTVAVVRVERVFAVAVRAADGRLLAVIPLEILKRRLATVAGFVGDRHANYHMGVFDRAFAAGLDAAMARQLLIEAGNAIGGLDALCFVHQPQSWDGITNPLIAMASAGSPSQAYWLKLESDGEATLKRSMSAHARKKMRSKRNRFAEMGKSRAYRATTDVQIDVLLGDFLRQKSLRFKAMGLPDPFAEPGVAEFIRQGARAGAMELYGLELNGRNVSCYLGTTTSSRFSGMATSFEPDEEISRTSPGELLLLDLIEKQCARGFDALDLGVGEARYKSTICDSVDLLFDTFVPLTPRGRAYVAIAIAKRRTKAWIKQTPWALSAVNRLRRDHHSSADA
jgi:CelD/BcsL family acetyltransferase involved in cellulose biosynthesis